MNSRLLLLFWFFLIQVTVLQGQPVKHSYRFYTNFSVSEPECGPDLTQAQALGSCNPAATAGSFITDTLPHCSTKRTIYHTNLHWGLKYPNMSGTVSSTYTIHMYVKTTNWGQTWARIIDFSDGLSDSGIYFKNTGSATDRCLDFYPTGIIGTCPYFNNTTYYLLTFTRNGQTGVINVYVNDKLFVSYNDVAGRYVGKTGTPIYIFRDDQAVTCESGEANFAYLSFTNQYSSQATVDAVYKDICSIANKTLSVDFTSSPNPGCSTSQNITITYTGDKLTPATDYTFDWNWDGGKVISGSGIGPYVVNWGTMGVKNVTLTVKSTACGKPIIRTKQVSIGNFALTASTKNSSCSGSSDGEIIMNATNGSPPYQYSIDSITYQNANLIKVAPKTYTVYAKDANGCVASVRATVERTNDITLQTLSDTSICQGQRVKLLTISNATEFSWLPALTLDNSAIKDPVAAPLASTTYVVTASSIACSRKDTVRITVIPPLELNPQSVQKACGTFLLSANSTGRVLWTGPGISGTRANQDTLVVTIAGSATYRVRASAGPGERCFVEKEIKLTFTPPTGYRLTDHTKNTCGSSTTLNAPTAGVWNSFRWQLPNGTIANQAELIAQVNGVYVLLASSSSTGCESRDTVTVNLTPTPPEPTARDVAICAGELLTSLTAVGTTINWFSDSTLRVQAGTGNTLKPNVSANQPIKLVYFLTQTGPNNCVSAPAKVRFEIKESPELNLAVKKYTGCFSNSPADTIALDAGENSNGIYSWYDMSGILIGSSRIVQVQKEGTYSIRVTNSQQCSKMDTVAVEEFCLPVLFAPDAFTPNNDSVNDVFEIKGRLTKEFTLSIYNRWGTLLVRTNKAQWDGFYQGQLCQPGEYTWKIVMRTINSGQQPPIHEKTGHVLLLR